MGYWNVKIDKRSNKVIYENRLANNSSSYLREEDPRPLQVIEKAYEKRESFIKEKSEIIKVDEKLEVKEINATNR